jgi:hypothetical protein
MQYFTVTIKIPKPSHHRTKVALVSVVLAALALGTWWTLLPGHFVQGMLITFDSSPELRPTIAQLARSPYVLNKVFDHPEIAKLPMLADMRNPVEWGKNHIEVDYASHPNLIGVRIFCHPKDREQAARLVTQIVETTVECIVRSRVKPLNGNQVKAVKWADSGQIAGYGKVGAFKKFRHL